VAKVVDRALAFDRNDRWSTAREMQDAVKEAYFEISGRRISFARKLFIPPRVSIPDTSEAATSAPTLAADVPSDPDLQVAVDTADRLRAIVAPKTTDGATMPSVPPPSRATTVGSHRNRTRRLALVAAGVGLAVLVIAVFVMRGPATASGGEIAVPSASGAVATASASASGREVAVASPSAGTSPSPSPTTSTSTSTSTPTATATATTPARSAAAITAAPHGTIVRPAIGRPKATASVATAAASAAPVDIFGRRR
jgi:hypothetical protein